MKADPEDEPQIASLKFCENGDDNCHRAAFPRLILRVFGSREGFIGSNPFILRF